MQILHGDSPGDEDPLSADVDDDWWIDRDDNCRFVSNPGQFDFDGDGRGDVCDDDIDDDRWSNSHEARAGTDPFDADSDGDSLLDSREEEWNDTDPLQADTDDDGIRDDVDNRGAVANPDQVGTDGDALGDACDEDDDNDRLADGLESRLGLDPLDRDTDDNGVTDDREDSDADGVPNGEEVQAGTDPGSQDLDGDDVADAVDNCLRQPNSDQADPDGDGAGNPCDIDDDGDGRWGLAGEAGRDRSARS